MLRGLVFAAATRLQRALLRSLGASTVGVRAIVVRPDGRFLRVRHSYRPGWYLVGGGVNPGETAIDAIKREMREEAGIVARDEPQLFGVYHHMFMGVNDYPVVYIVRSFEEVPCDCPEIDEIGWFPLDALPPDTRAGSRQRLLEYAAGASLRPHW